MYLASFNCAMNLGLAILQEYVLILKNTQDK